MLLALPSSLFTLQKQANKPNGMPMKPVSELLKNRNATLYQVAPKATVFEALQWLAKFGVGAMVVMDNDKLVGVFSERDYTRKVALQGKNSKETTVADIMTREVITVTSTTGTRTCMTLMSQKKIRHLPVVDGTQVKGMISIRDIMDDIISDHEQTISQLTNYIRS
jgi:signal-transduction protein with cAMP-binding, CBS, and nucleotidyltransferase domain